MTSFSLTCEVWCTGLYECVAENMAGKIYCTASVRITEKPHVDRSVTFTNVPIEDHFHVIDEIGRCVLQVVLYAFVHAIFVFVYRGSCGVVRRTIEKNWGTQYAAKFLRYSDQTWKEELETELEMMSDLDHTNVVQVVDGYEDKKRLIIVIEM